MALENPGLGTLSKLCPEIRLQLWKELLRKDVPELPKSKVDLNILRASRQLHDEVSFEFYGHHILQIKLSPRYKYQSWITISNLEGCEWHLKDLRDAASQGFDTLPYRLLKQLKLEIEAPDAADPGQMVCLWKKAKDLVELLEKAGGLPSLEIDLQDTEDAKWCRGGEPQESIWIDPLVNPIDPDFKVILALFAFLPNAGDVRLRLPEEVAEFCKVNELVENWNELFEPQIPCTQEYQHEWFMVMDRRLDTMYGPTAAMMRLERFSTWYTDHLHGESKYMDELQRIISAGRGRTSENDVLAIGCRYRAMRAYSTRAHVEFGEGNTKHTQYTRRWATERWHAQFPLGIQPLNPRIIYSLELCLCRELVQEDWSYIYHRLLYEGQEDTGNIRPDLGEKPWNPFSIMEYQYEGYNGFRLQNLGVHLTKKALMKKKDELAKRQLSGDAMLGRLSAVCIKVL